MTNIGNKKMDDEQQSNWGINLLFLFVGSAMTLILTIATHLWLIPSQEKRLHRYEQIEQKVSKLYQPMMLATGYGNLSLASDIPFYKVLHILEDYGHLADQEVIDKFIEFLKLCRFADYDDLSSGTSLQNPIPEGIIKEILRRGDPPLKWTGNSLEEANKVDEEFHIILKKYYEQAYKNFKMS